ncbi:uncharacterized protein [Ptychodera flava]|uniref:uncharacterized protein isoform X2 n=1 Tax=Ptychodera flava TaxID=63121 RepID=UPI00396A3DCB
MAAMDLKCGYLDFRNPSKEFWYTVRLWSRKWVQVRANTASEGLSVLLEAYEDQNEYDKIVVCILLEKVSTVRRSPIKNRYALEIFSGDRPLVYLAADSETVCHEWISVFKKALLPSMPTIRTLPDVGTVFHHVWALPMGSANKLRLNGEFLLAITGENFTLYNETGTLCLQWKLNHIRRFAVCNDKDISPADYGKILYVNTGSQCEDGEGEYYFYSIQAKDILQQILDKIGEAMEKIKLSQEKEGRQGKEQEIQTEDSADKNVEELVTELDGDRADGLAGNGSKEETSLDNVSVNTSISWTSESSVGSSKVEKTCAETVLATAVNKNTTPSKETPSVAKEVPTGRAKSEHIGMSESTSGNVRTPPDGNDQSSDNYLVTSPHSTRPLANGDARIDFEPMAASPPSLSGTLLYPSPAVRLRGNSTSSSGYSSDPLEINGLYECSRSDHGHSDDAHSLTSASNSNVSFVSRFSERDSFQSDTSAFSFSSGPERLTKTRRNTFSGSNEKNYERDRDQITESNRSHRNRVIQRRSTLSSINELYRSREDDCNQAPFLKDIDNIMPKRSSVDSIGNSSLDEFDDNKTNDVISDTSVDESADIPAPFDLLDIYLLSARAKLMKDSETSADRGAGHVTNQVQPPTLPRRTSSLQVNSPLSVSTENKQQKTKEKGRQRRRSSIFTSLAENLCRQQVLRREKKRRPRNGIRRVQIRVPLRQYHLRSRTDDLVRKIVNHQNIRSTCVGQRVINNSIKVANRWTRLILTTHSNRHKDLSLSMGQGQRRENFPKRKLKY